MDLTEESAAWPDNRTRSKTGELTPTERTELDEYERIEHVVVMIKMRRSY